MALRLSAALAHTPSQPTLRHIGYGRGDILLQVKEVRGLAPALATMGAVCAHNLRGTKVRRGGFVGVPLPEEVPHGNQGSQLTILRGVGQ